MEEDIPIAPAFCERLSVRDAETKTKELTEKSLTDLNNELKSNLTKIKEKEVLKPLTELDGHVKLANLLTEYFELDEVNQKARMLELFKETIELRKNNREQRDFIKNKEVHIREMKEELDELNEQLTIFENENRTYEKKLEEKEDIIRKDKERIEHMKTSIKFWRVLFLIVLILKLI